MGVGRVSLLDVIAVAESFTCPDEDVMDRDDEVGVGAPSVMLVVGDSAGVSELDAVAVLDLGRSLVGDSADGEAVSVGAVDAASEVVSPAILGGLGLAAAASCSLTFSGGVGRHGDPAAGEVELDRNMYWK